MNKRQRGGLVLFITGTVGLYAASADNWQVMGAFAIMLIGAVMFVLDAES